MVNFSKTNWAVRRFVFQFYIKEISQWCHTATFSLIQNTIFMRDVIL